MKQLLSLIICLSLCLTLHAQRVNQPAPKGTWKILGNVQANHSADHDAILVNGPYDFFRQVKFKVTNASLNMQYMVVRYDDGGAPERIDVRYNIPKGGESRVIDLNGGKRKLKSIEFWYDTKGFIEGKADVILFGLK
jgi:hypothetical protein